MSCLHLSLHLNNGVHCFEYPCSFDSVFFQQNQLSNFVKHLHSQYSKRQKVKKIHEFKYVLLLNHPGYSILLEQSKLIKILFSNTYDFDMTVASPCEKCSPCILCLPITVTPSSPHFINKVLFPQIHTSFIIWLLGKDSVSFSKIQPQAPCSNGV